VFLNESTAQILLAIGSPENVAKITAKADQSITIMWWLFALSFAFLLGMTWKKGKTEVG
jgi:hypothetical protein